MDPNKQQAALALKNDATKSVSEICKILSICRNTYYKYVSDAEETKNTQSKKG